MNCLTLTNAGMVANPLKVILGEPFFVSFYGWLTINIYIGMNSVVGAQNWQFFNWPEISSPPPFCPQLGLSFVLIPAEDSYQVWICQSSHTRDSKPRWWCDHLDNHNDTQIRSVPLSTDVTMTKIHYWKTKEPHPFYSVQIGVLKSAQIG